MLKYQLTSRTDRLISRHENVQLHLEHNFYSNEQDFQWHFIICHGALEYTHRHRFLKNYLLKSFPRSVVTQFDLRGHGLSGGRKAFVNHFKEYEDDLEDVYLKSTLEFNSQKKILIGHSLGGLIVLRTLLKEIPLIHPDRCIFSNPCLKVKTPLKEIAGDLLHKLSDLNGHLQVPSIYRGKDLSNDIQMANEFDTDPLISNFMTLKMSSEVLRASDEIRPHPYYWKIPSLFMISDQDLIVDAYSTELFCQGIKRSLVEKVKFSSAKHELFNEIERDKVFDKMVKWLRQES